MVIRMILMGLLIVGVAGCATTRGKSDQEQLQARVVDLEKKVEEKDAEIVNLQYDVKDLTSRIDNTQTEAAAEPAAVTNTVAVKSSGDVIRVNVDPAAVQSALKKAGVYNGKVDGKIGPATKAAIIEFQKSNGLTADGVVGRRTWELLKSKSK